MFVHVFASLYVEWSCETDWARNLSNVPACLFKKQERKCVFCKVKVRMWGVDQVISPTIYTPCAYTCICIYDKMQEEKMMIISTNSRTGWIKASLCFYAFDYSVLEMLFIMIFLLFTLFFLMIMLSFFLCCCIILTCPK